MHPSEDAFTAGALVILNKAIIEACFHHVVFVISLHEVSSAVAVDRRRDHAEALYAVYIILYLYLSHLSVHSFSIVPLTALCIAWGYSVRA